MGISFGNGIQFLFDAQQRYTRAGLPVYLRVKNFQDAGAFIEVGVPFTPTGSESFYTGYTDILITPPPAVQDVSLHNIGLNSAALRFGARIFIISASFVTAQLAELNNGPNVSTPITDPYAVFRGRDGYEALGLYYNDRVFSIESITHKEVAGVTINYKLLCNALELQSDSTSHSPGDI